ncbi:general substrate transporter [Coniochaeta sp. PMI_546]|nr:general substrate transporter [Coniochaeta sp. PMI_546]
MAPITPLTAAITSITSVSFLLFGYDQGLMSGVVLSDSWKSAMGDPTPLEIGSITAVHAVGALCGAVEAAMKGESWGRKRTLLSGAALVLVGGAGMASAPGSGARRSFCLGRFLAGWGVGVITGVAPVYQTEISDVGQRGWLVCCQLTTMLVGLALAYWVDYAFYFHPGEMQWRFPVGLQCAFALYVIALGLWLPDTPRWLMKNGRQARARIVLARLRGREVDDIEVKREVDEIEEAIRTESKSRGTWSDLWKDRGVMADKRFYLAVGIQFMQQCTGINIVTYYASTLYKETLGMNQERAMLLGCWTQMWYVLASLVTWYTIDRVGRRKLLISMALGMSLVLVGEAVSIGIGTPRAAIAAVVCVLLFEACFTWGWMACVWIYPPEILPLSIRAKGSGLAAAADFLGNYLVVQVTPIGIRKMGAWFYVVWAVFNLVNAAVVWLYYPETGGLTLEAIDSVFTRDEEDSGSTSDAEGHTTGLPKLQWSKVRIAAEMVRESRAAKKRGTATESETGLLAADGTPGYGTTGDV